MYVQKREQVVQQKEKYQLAVVEVNVIFLRKVRERSDPLLLLKQNVSFSINLKAVNGDTSASAKRYYKWQI